MAEQIDHPCAIGEPEHLPHRVGAHHASGVGDRLIEQRQRIAHRAFGGARDQPERLGLDLDAFLGGDIAEVLHQHVGIDAAQIESLAARQHRHRHLADFGGREHEFGVLGRLLQRLQKGVEGRIRQHVHFVDDVDLVARAGRGIAHAIVDLTDVIDAGVRGGVHLQHIHVPAFHDRLTMHAEHRHVDGRPFHRAIGQFVVERTRQNARSGGLADAAHAGQHPGLRNPPSLERIGQRPHHGVLADQMVEAAGAIFAGQHPIGCRRGSGRRLAERKTRLLGNVARRKCRGASVSHHSIRKGCLSEPGCGNALAIRAALASRLPRRGTIRIEGGWPCKRPSIGRSVNSLRKTSRRLTSDPIRTSLGLLPSGPDPVGEWLVHRQSPGAYLALNRSECKRGDEDGALW